MVLSERDNILLTKLMEVLQMNFIIDLEGLEFQGGTFLEVLKKFHCDTLDWFSQQISEEYCTHEDISEILLDLSEIFEDGKDIENYDGAIEIIERYQQVLYKYDRNYVTISFIIEWEV